MVVQVNDWMLFAPSRTADSFSGVYDRLGLYVPRACASSGNLLPHA